MEADSEKIDQWSMSRLNVYEECARRAYYQYKEKIPEPDRGTPPPDKYPSGEWPNDRGERVHKEAELYVKGLGDMPSEASHFEPSLEALRTMYTADPESVVLEDMWGITKNWEITGAFDEDTWGRIKMDALAISGDHGVAIDYKTGKRKFNEIKHGEQLILYVIGAFLKYKHLKTVTGELWYFDIPDLHRREYTRQQAMHFIKNFNNRALALCEDTTFTPKPSAWNCRFCPYGPGEGKTNHCEVGVEKQ